MSDFSLFAVPYAYVDHSSYLADQLFVQNKITMKFKGEMVKEGSAYCIVFCKVLKRDVARFEEALERLKDKMLLLGHKDYPAACGEIAKMIEEAGADALEINILALQSEVQYTYGSFDQRHIDILRRIKQTVNIPVIMKLGDNLTNPVVLIDQLYANGAAAVVLFNRFYQPDINIEKMEHISGEIFSNASDLANPLRWIGIASAVVDKIDYAASGGVANAEAVVKAILAGASAVEVCSAVYLNTNAFIGEANRFLSAWMERKGFENIAQFKGKLNIKDVQGVNTFERTQFLKYFGKKE